MGWYVSRPTSPGGLPGGALPLPLHTRLLVFSVKRFETKTGSCGGPALFVFTGLRVSGPDLRRLPAASAFLLRMAFRESPPPGSSGSPSGEPASRPGQSKRRLASPPMRRLSLVKELMTRVSAALALCVPQILFCTSNSAASQPKMPDWNAAAPFGQSLALKAGGTDGSDGNGG